MLLSTTLDFSQTIMTTGRASLQEQEQNFRTTASIVFTSQSVNILLMTQKY